MSKTKGKLKNKISCLGLWHLGCVYSACLAEQGFNVVGFDPNKEVISNLQNNAPPIYEPGLEELVIKNNHKTLKFTNNSQEAIKDQDYCFITLDTPVDNQDKVLLRSFNFLVDEVIKYVSPKTIIVISSQVPVGTCRNLEQRLKKIGKDNSVIYFPENLRLGQALDTFQKPDRIILGGDEKIRKKFLLDFKFFKSPVFEMSLESAEMSKHTLNSYLALMISFCSEISDFCERLSADSNDVMKALKGDQRVSATAPLYPGIGFAGGTLGRDLQTLKMVAKKINYNPKLTKAAYQVNQDRLTSLVEKMTKTLGSLKHKKIGLLGLTYKPKTDTLRRSQSLELANLLKTKGVEVRAIDPAIKNSSNKLGLKIYQDYGEFFNDLDAVVLMTWWDEFKKLRPNKFASLMKSRVVFDTRNFLDEKLWKKAGFLYFGIGSGIE